MSETKADLEVVVDRIEKRQKSIVRRLDNIENDIRILQGIYSAQKSETKRPTWKKT